MFEAIIKRLNGSAYEPASISEALAQLDRDKKTVTGELDALNQRRRQALLEDATDAVLDKIERQIDRATIQLEKLTLAEQPLRDQLEAARARATQEQKERDRNEFAAAFEPLAKDAFDLSRRAGALAARVESLHLDPSMRQSALPLLAFLAGWIEERRPAIESALGRETANSEPTALAPVRSNQARSGQLPHERERKRLPTTDNCHKAATNALIGPSPTFAARETDDASALEPGQARVKVTRSGFSPADDRPQAHRGQLLRMPAGAARRAADAGAVEIVEERP